MSKKAQSAKTVIRKNNLKLIEVNPLTEAQEVFFENYDTGKSQVLSGAAGTGKTFIALYKAFDEIINSKTEYRRIVIVRSAVETRSVGFLPGTIEEKAAVYEMPYVGVLNELFQNGTAYDVLKKTGVVNFMLTSYVRGITLDKTIVIVDETQNLTKHELSSIITRLGKDSKILFCGDTKQSDLTKHSEMDQEDFFKILKRMTSWFDFNLFSVADIVRSGLVKAFLIESEK